MVPNPTRLRNTLLILLLLLLLAALPLSVSAAGTGTITAPADHVEEGGILQLAANMSGSVTWASSNPGLATVSSTGRVTGIQAGQVTITARCSGYTDATITLWVTVPDGVYYIKNASSGYCMQTTEDTTYVYTQNTSQEGRINQLWKIAYISNGNYVIRPLRDFSVAMTTASGYVAVADADMSDSSVPSNMYWKIIHNAFGYAFKHGGSDAKTAMPSVNGPTGVPVYPSSWTANFNCHWTLQPINGVFLRDTATLRTVSSSTPKIIELSTSSLPLSSLGLRYEYVGTYVGMGWTSSNTSVATVSSSGAVTPIGRGNAVITLSMNLGGTIYTARYSVTIKETINVINLYDSTLSGNSEIFGYIDDAVSFLNTVYSADHYITFTSSNNPALYTNTVDECPLLANAQCSTTTCGANCLNHHKNITRIAFWLEYTQWMPNNVVVLWSNSLPNTFCVQDDNSNHTTVDSLGVTISELIGNAERLLPVVQILTVNRALQGTPYESYSKEYMAIVLAHEIAHTFGLKEIYENNYGDCTDHTNDSNMQCIMDYAFAPGMIELYSLGSDALCDYCRSKLQLEIPSNAYEN